MARSINQALRDHTTSATFVLTLGSSHIAALVLIDHQLRTNLSIEEDIDGGGKELRGRQQLRVGPHARAFSLNGGPGLVRRGLTTHTMPTSIGWKPSQIWTITPAGRLVIALLAEAGIWAEYGGVDPSVPYEPPVTEPAKRVRRRAA